MLLVVCKLAKIWFIMQRTLSQINAVSTFFLQEIFFIRSFSAKPRVCFCSTVADSSWCFSLRSFVSSSTCFLNQSCLSDPCFGERVAVAVPFHTDQHQRGGQGRANLRPGGLLKLSSASTSAELSDQGVQENLRLSVHCFRFV